MNLNLDRDVLRVTVAPVAGAGKVRNAVDLSH
jgi:hypothetical protein